MSSHSGTKAEIGKQNLYAENLYALFRSRFPADLSQVFLETGQGSVYSYGDLERETARYAALLAGLGLAKGDRVLAQVEKSPQALFLCLACFRAGLIYLPLNPAYRKNEVQYVLSDAEPKAVVCGPGTSAQSLLQSMAQSKTRMREWGVEQVETLDANAKEFARDVVGGRRGRADDQHPLNPFVDRLHPLEIGTGQQVTLPHPDIATLGFAERRTINHGKDIARFYGRPDFDGGLTHHAAHTRCNPGKPRLIETHFPGALYGVRQAPYGYRFRLDAGLGSDGAVEKANAQLVNLTPGIVGARQQTTIAFHPNLRSFIEVYVRGGRLFGLLGIQGGPFRLDLRITQYTLRLGQPVPRAPVVRGFELGDQG
ncbi:MAG: AMP-binding protein [Planctomycetes bacterium]|nr:AMP-binding protein [Planctomycetota bacterium]